MPTTDTDGLTTLGLSERLPVYLRAMWARRDFTIELAKNDFRSNHMDSALGQAWHLLNPAFNIGIYFLIFGVVLDARRGVDNYVTFLVIGVMFFRLVQSAVIDCSSSIGKNSGLIRSIQFPRALVPVSVVLQAVMQFAPSVVLIAIISVFDVGAPGWHWLGIPAVLVATIAIALGLGLLAANIGAFLPDLQQLLPHIFRLGLYVSGVFFAVDERISNETIRSLYFLNPFYDIIEAARWAFMGRPLGERVIVGLTAWAVVSLVAGILVFKRGEHRYGG
jgi:teichoic acid transport system permease protein